MDWCASSSQINDAGGLDYPLAGVQMMWACFDRDAPPGSGPGVKAWRLGPAACAAASDQAGRPGGSER